jgi:hypothetical protein
VLEFYLIFGLKNRAKALAKQPLLFAIHPEPLIFLPILADQAPRSCWGRTVAGMFMVRRRSTPRRIADNPTPTHISQKTARYGAPPVVFPLKPAC